MVVVFLKDELTLGPYLMETLTIGVRYYPVGISMNDECRPLIVGCRLVDRQRESRAD